MKNEDRLTIRLGKKLIKDLKITSELEGESISFIIRTVLQDYMDYYLWRKSNNKTNSDE